MPQISFAGDATYVALLKLPNALLEQLKAEPLPDIKVTFSNDSTSLQIGGYSHECSSMSVDGECSIVEAPGGVHGVETLASVGNVDDRLHVALSLGGAGSSVRKQIKERHDQAQAEKEGNHRIVLEGAGRSDNSNKQPFDKKLKGKNGAALSAASVRKPHVAPSQRPPSSSGASAARAAASSRAVASASCAPTSHTEPQHAKGSTVEAEAEAREWCVHLLALGPSNLQGLLKGMRTGLCNSAAQDPKLLKRVLAQVARLKDHERFHLMPSMLGDASPEWSHYNQAQRSTLRAQRAAKNQGTSSSTTNGTSSSTTNGTSSSTTNGTRGSSSSSNKHPLVGQEATRPAISSVAEAPVVRSEGAYNKITKLFEHKYRMYQQLDLELADQTKFFEDLTEMYQRASAEERPAIYERLTREFDERKVGFRKRARDYRVLHLELKGLKEAVNTFVSSYEKSD